MSTPLSSSSLASNKYSLPSPSPFSTRFPTGVGNPLVFCADDDDGGGRKYALRFVTFIPAVLDVDDDVGDDGADGIVAFSLLLVSSVTILRSWPAIT